MQNTRYVALIAILALSLLPAAAPAAGPQIITACTTITKPGAYVLGQNLTATGDCLQIAADFVTVDFAGFTITGNKTGEGVTDNNAAHHGIVIRNGVIRTFRIGIFLFDTTGSVIEHMRVSDNQFDGIDVGSGNLVRSNIAQNNHNGITVSGGSIVSGNLALSNENVGIQVGCASNVFENTAANNGVNLQLLGVTCNDTNNVH